MATINGTSGDDSLLGTAGSDAIYGYAGNDTMYGYAGNDTLNGHAGRDVMFGGLGSDTYYVDDAGDQVVETSASGGLDRIYAYVSRTLWDYQENLYLLGANAATGMGNSLNNFIFGSSADNYLDGKAGSDTMYGGYGNDGYEIDSAGDVIVETNAAGGIDWVSASVSWTLGTNFEKLYLAGAAAINGTGNSLDNYLKGNSAANVLRGGGGNDTMYGQGGDDTYYVDGGDAIVEVAGADGGTDTICSSVSRSLGAWQENLRLTGTAAINGYGNDLANRLYGNGARNLLDGGAGPDSMEGGAGDDGYVVDTAADHVIETSASGGYDWIESSVSWTLGDHVEKLYLAGYQAINGTGNLLGNRIFGNSAANRLSGGGGSDSLYGGAGTDTLNGGPGSDLMSGGEGSDAYYVDSAGDVVVESSAAAGGIDWIDSSVTFTLGDYQESLYLRGTGDIDGTGNGLNNVLYGASGSNSLLGYAGNDYLVGGAGSDHLNGGAGDDTLSGNSGSDELVGGVGRDIYRFNSNLDASTNVDTVGGFASHDDTIQLYRTIFTALTTVGTLPEAAFYKSAMAVGAHDASDRVIYNMTTGSLYYDPDGTGGTAAVRFAVLTGSPDALTNADFVVA